MSRFFDNTQSEYLEMESAVIASRPFAMVGFLWPDDLTNYFTMMSIQDKDVENHRYSLTMHDSGSSNVILAQTQDGGGANSAASSTGCVISTWNHFAGIFVSATDRRAFRDGASKGTNATSSTPANLDRTSIARLGVATPSSYVSGALAGCAIYDLSVWPGGTDSDKADNFEKILPSLAKGFSPLLYPLGLIAYWPFIKDNDSDIVGGNVLTAYNTPTWGGQPRVYYPQAAQIRPPVNAEILLASIATEASTTSCSLSVNTKLQGSSDNNTNVSGELKSTDLLIGSAVETSTASGSLDIATELQGAADSTTNISGAIEASALLVGSSTSITIVSGSLNIVTKLQGISEAATTATGVFDFTINMQGTVTETSIALSSLNVITTLQGVTAGGPSLVGSLIGILLDTMMGDIDSSSELFGVLFVETELISNVLSTLAISGQLNVNTQLQSKITDVLWNNTEYVEFEDDSVAWQANAANVALATSGVTGWLGFWIFLASVLSETSACSGSLDRQPGLVGTSIEASDGECYLTLVPDFEAATLFWRPQSKIIETLTWNTRILKSHNGTEQRIKVRNAPRQNYKLRIFLDSDGVNSWYDSLLHAWQKLVWLVPVWPEYVIHTGTITKEDIAITVDTTYADFRASNKAIIWKSATEYEVVKIGTKTDSQLNIALNYAILNNFTGTKYIMPVRTANMVAYSKKVRTRYGQAFVDLVFAVQDNINITGYQKPANYDNIDLLTEPTFMDETYLEESNADIIISDNQTGVFNVSSNSDFNILARSHKFFNDTKAACWNFRQFLHSLNGKQKSILIPTFRGDVVQTENIDLTDTSVRIQDIKLSDNMGLNDLRKYIGFYFPDGSLVVRKISAISRLSSTEEQISFDYNLDLTSVVESGDCNICFVDKCRLSSDKVEMRWDFAYKNECNTSFTRVK